MNTPPARFRIIDEPFGEAACCRLLDTETMNSAAVLPFLGGSINSFRIQKEGSPVEMLNGYSSYEETKAVASSFKGSNLFPFPNRIQDGRYHYDGSFYQLPLNFPEENNAIHGLVYDKEFVVKKRLENLTECILELEYNSWGQEQGYPFPFRLTNRYCLNRDRGLTCSTLITNCSAMTIPVGHGFHPYFSAGADSIDDLILQFSAKHQLQVNPRNIPTGAHSAYNSFDLPKKINGTTLDNCFSLDQLSRRFEANLTNPRLDICLNIWQDTGPGKYNYLQIYTPPDRRSIAVEPMTCPPNGFNNSEGIIHLYPGNKVDFSWGIQLNA